MAGMDTDRRRPPDDVLVAAAEGLGAVAEHEAELFALRVARWWPDLRDGLEALHDAPVAHDLARRLVALAGRAFAERAPELKRLDQVRTLEPDWFQQPRVLGYATYVDRFADDLRGVAEHIDHLEALGVTYLHLMPLLRTRDGPNDGGYAVIDYRSVSPDIGTVDDLRELATLLRARGISLCLDLVLNHIAREHRWAEAARDGDPRYRRYFHVFGDRALPDAFERTLPEVFPDFAPGNFTWDDDLDGWVWTTFNSWQWDVDWSNPDVFCEYADVVLFLANLGVEVVRLDAVAFLWKRLGTTSQNEPEVHAITQALHALTRIACPAVAFKAEAIVGPADVVHYLGRGVHHGKVSDLAYHNTLMVQIWSMLAMRDVRLAVHVMGAIAEVPSTTAWITYVRCHDDIGWAIDDADAAAVELSGHAHRTFLSDYYSGDYWQSPARGLVFQHNEATGDRRISGTTASLAGRGVASDDEVVARILLAHTIVLGWGGLPVLWMGDELALPNDDRWADDPLHADDNRWAHRPRMPWAGEADRHVAGSVEQRVFNGLARRASIRAGLEHLHASVRTEPLEPSDPGILLLLRRHHHGPMLGVYNVTERRGAVPLRRLHDVGLDPPTALDVLTGTHPAAGVDADADATVEPYGAWWLVSDRR